jgi:serine/threonine-protein kinase
MHTHNPIPSICRLRPELPAEMDTFILKALAKAPAARFQSPAEYMAAIEQLQQRIRGSIAPPQPEASLVLLDGGQVFLLQGTKMLVGREDPRREIHPEVLINDEHKTVGRVHACFSCQDGQWSIEDRNARNKTRLNGDILIPYEPRMLKNGDLLRFGRIEARFELH